MISDDSMEDPNISVLVISNDASSESEEEIIIPETNRKLVNFDETIAYPDGSLRLPPICPNDSSRNLSMTT